MKNRLATLVGALALSAAASAQTWIWYPGDYEIWLGNQHLCPNLDMVSGGL